MEVKTISLRNQTVLVTKYENGIQYEMPSIHVTIAEGDTTGIPVCCTTGKTFNSGSIILCDNKVRYVVFVCKSEHTYYNVLI